MSDEKAWFEINGRVVTFVIVKAKRTELLSCMDKEPGNMFQDNSETDVYTHTFKSIPTEVEIVELVKTRAAVFSV
jgi:hypothetical protein